MLDHVFAESREHHMPLCAPPTVVMYVSNRCSEGTPRRIAPFSPPYLNPTNPEGSPHEVPRSVERRQRKCPRSPHASLNSKTQSL